MRSAGIVAIGSGDEEYRWTGGHYYLQHLIKCAASLAPEARIPLRDVWWMSPFKTDPFLEVRSLLGEPLIVYPPEDLIGRLGRKLSALGRGTEGARDLFDNAGVDVFFPTPPCENSGTPYVYWIPDFQHARRPDLVSDRIRTRLDRDISHHVARASRIVLSSFDAQRDFAERYPDKVDRTHVVQFCSVPSDEWWQLRPCEVAAKHKLPDRFVIACNQFTRHKNHLGLLEAMHRLEARGLREMHLVCTGSTFDYREEDYVGQVAALSARYGLEARVHILGLIPRAEQIALLRRSVAVVQPSMFEGWSTIVEDAKTLGKPVIASDLPVHREQLGEQQAHYVSPDEPDAWADALATIWQQFEPGPDAAAEAAGLARLEQATHRCGSAFVAALRAATPRDGA